MRRRGETGCLASASHPVYRPQRTLVSQLDNRHACVMGTRPSRNEEAGAIHHVVPQGNGRRRIVESDGDRRAYTGTGLVEADLGSRVAVSSVDLRRCESRCCQSLCASSRLALELVPGDRRGKPSLVCARRRTSARDVRLDTERSTSPLRPGRRGCFGGHTTSAARRGSGRLGCALRPRVSHGWS